MQSQDHIQIGLLKLPLAASSAQEFHTRSSSGCGSSSGPTWWPLTPEILESTCFAPDYAQPLVALKHLLRDPGVGLQAAYCVRRGRAGNREGKARPEGECVDSDRDIVESGRVREMVVREMVVRLGLVPSDAAGSRWRRVGEKRREGWLRCLFGWSGRGWESDVDDGEDERLMGLTAEDEQKMPDIYASVPSPPEPSFQPSGMAADDDVQQRLMIYDNPDGIKSPLYPFQVRSVAKMLQMETAPGRLVDPCFTPFRESGRDGIYYVNLATFDIQRHPGWYDLPRGGILCEQMGIGKTLMCLSLIVATLHQPCQPPPNGIDMSPILTANAQSTYPFESYRSIRESVDIPESSICPTRPSLEDMCADILAKTDHSPRRSPFVPPTVLRLLDRQTFYYQYPSHDDCLREAKKKVLKRSIHKMHLANTTLVVVPQILVGQWKNEIGKHMADGVLRVYEVGNHELPAIEEVLQFDVVLMDVARFGQEETMHRLRLDLEPSVLLQARWKRLILDEGHVAGEKLSNAMRLATSLSIERRWAVSGTPTKHLQQGGEIDVEIGEQPMVSRRRSEGRIWSKRDLDDVTRLGVIIGGFLAAEPFHSEAGFQDRVTNRLRGKAGPKFGAVQRLKYIMAGTMVKHRSDATDIKTLLPPTSLATETLQFHPMQRITYNVLAALIASNGYMTNFVDIDYFLHSRNVASYNEVINNLHLACFWFSAPEMGIAAALKRTLEFIDNSKTIAAEDRVVLLEASEHLQKALDTPGWEEWMTNGVSLPFDVDPNAVPTKVREAWSDSMDTAPDMIDASSLDSLRRLNTRERTPHDLHIAGWDARAARTVQMTPLWLEMERIVQLAERKERNDESRNALASAANKPTKVPKRSVKKEPGDKKSKIDQSLDQAAQNAIQAATASAAAVSQTTPLPSVIHTRSRSAKVNFVIDNILTSDHSDKFVIFGDNYELGHLTEALDLFDIKSCFAGLSVSDAKRVAALEQFEQDPKMNICLLELKLAARGLNLICANRMIFLSPVWSLDVQAQAIKRVHRIGQTRPTKVEILVTEGTFEEDIAKRGSSARSADEEVRYSRAMIEKPRFVYPESEAGPLFEARFVPLAAVQPKPSESPLELKACPLFGRTSEAQSSPLSSAPTDNSPMTPVSRRNHPFLTDISPLEERFGPASPLSPSLKRSPRDEAVTKTKKKARVAFA